MALGWNVALGYLLLKLYLRLAMNQREIFGLKWTVTMCFPGVIFTKRLFVMATCLHRGARDDTIYFRANISLSVIVCICASSIAEICLDRGRVEALEAKNTPVFIIAGLRRWQILTKN